MNDAFICDAIRTPFGRYGGALKDVVARTRQAKTGVGQGIALAIERM